MLKCFPGKGASQAPVLKQSQKEYIQSGQPITAIKDNAIIRNVQKTMGNPATAFVTASLVQDNQPIFNSGRCTISLGILSSCMQHFSQMKKYDKLSASDQYCHSLC